MEVKKRLLIIDDEENMLHMLSAVTEKEGYRVTVAKDGQEGVAALGENAFDFILCDLKMPRMDGMQFLRIVQERAIEAPVVMMSAYAAIEDAVRAMRMGAYDFITKPFKIDEVLLVLERAAEHERLRRENRDLRRQVEDLRQPPGFCEMVGRSAAMTSFFKLADKVARYDSTVLVTGESGTGKELVARGLHQKSNRAGKPFVAVNCGSMPESLLESEFFGYVRGAFTGADADRKGLFKEAEGGTIFLDEIGEMPLAAQVKLLRVLQEQEIRPVGAPAPVPVDVRVITATARDLSREVEAGKFRQDLFFRLNVITLNVPALRERKEDIPLLCDHFVKKMNRKLGADVQGVSPAAMSALMRHDWPGNVRELENVLERAVVLAEKKIILPENLPESLGGANKGRRIDDFFGTFSLKEGRRILEERFIRRALEVSGGNKSRAAELLEMSYPSLLSKIKEYGCE